jgi:hypothetical protein
MTSIATEAKLASQLQKRGKWPDYASCLREVQKWLALANSNCTDIATKIDLGNLDPPGLNTMTVAGMTIGFYGAFPVEADPLASAVNRITELEVALRAAGTRLQRVEELLATAKRLGWKLMETKRLEEALDD